LRLVATDPDAMLGPVSAAFDEAKRVEPLRPAQQQSPDPAEKAEKWDEKAALQAAANRELQGDLLEPSVKYLAGIAAIAACAIGAYLFSFLLLVPHSDPPWAHARDPLVQLLVASIVLSAIMFGVTKIPKLRASRVLDLGYIYLFGLSLLLGLLRHLHPWPDTELIRAFSPVVLPILAFGALIPATPRIALATSLGAAAMDPLALYMLASGVPPAPYQVVFLLGSPLLAAFAAYLISRVVHQLSQDVEKAREIGSYRLVERLGTGGMSDVWRAEHLMLARPAAVKLIRREVLFAHGPQESERLLRLFLREARATAKLSSPHTIQVYDFGITRDGAFYYVMELLDGVDLKRLVERYGPQTPERTAHLMRHVCRSLYEAHQNGFVHRDVKPANVFMCLQGGEYDFGKVLDFGLVLDRHPTAEEIDDEKRFIGTPSIMAPEMLRFQAPVDARVDIYALGCVGYWLLTGQRVFEATTRHDMLVMHAHQKPVTPSKRIGKEIHAGLEAVIMSCLEKNPGRRPQTARELRERLEGLAFAAPWSEERAELWWRRHGPKPAEKYTAEQVADMDARERGGSLAEASEAG
jgi:eukaryotic-like serine/threonine-protein kinase